MRSFTSRLRIYLKALLFLVIIFSLTDCSAVNHQKKISNRKKGFMLLENTSQSLNKKYKKSRYAKKAERHRKKGKR